MAKSIRSKWKRKCRAVKRERYGKKELEQLKKTLGMGNEHNSNSDTNMQDLSEIVTVTTTQQVKNKKKDNTSNVVGNMEEEQIKSKFNAKTLRDDNGAYPIWLHPRKIRKVNKKIKKTKTKGKINKKKKGNV